MPAIAFYVTMPSTPLASQPRISIVIPSFNQAGYLETAIQSVMTQLPAGGELIVMDGGSTDGSIDVIARYHDRLTYWASVADEGPAAALQAGFARASGDIYGFLNADDFLLPGALASILEWFISHPTADVVSGHGFFATADGVLGPEVRSDRWDLTRVSHGACVLLQPATFFRSSAFRRTGGFRQQSGLCWDMQLWLDLAREGADFHLLAAPLAAFRLHTGSISGSADHRSRRIDDAKILREKVLGRSVGRLERLIEWRYRLQKFASHPWLTLRQRLFFRRVLLRWAI